MFANSNPSSSNTSKKRKSMEPNTVPDKEEKNIDKQQSEQSKSFARQSSLLFNNSQEANIIHGIEDTHFQSENYQSITHNLSIGPSGTFCCRGANTDREILTLDFKSKDLEAFFNRFSKHIEVIDAATQPLDGDEADDSSAIDKESKSSPITQNPYEIETLQKLVGYVYANLLPADQDQLLDLLDQQHEKQPLSENKKIAPLEWFLAENIGVCRHHALACIYLLVKLIEGVAEQNSKTYKDTNSKVYRFRIKFPKTNSSGYSSHAVVIYEAENGDRYFLDSTRRKVANLSRLTNTEIVEFNKLYGGNKFFEKIMEVYDNLAKLNHHLSKPG